MTNPAEEKMDVEECPLQQTAPLSRLVIPPKSVEKMEEDKLKAKYNLPGNWRGNAHSMFLQKKLAKGQKFFDSGDYQMAKQTMDKSAKAGEIAKQMKFATGEEIPTPETVPARKTSIIQPKHFVHQQ